MEPVTIGLAAGAIASSFLGARRAAKAQKEQLARSEALQREFAQTGIQWRVEDAKKAGLHPLFALGASTSGPTLPIMDDPYAKAFSDMGQELSSAARAQQTPAQKSAADTATRVAESQIAKNDAEAWYYESLAMRNFVGDNSRPGMPAMSGDATTPGASSVLASPQSAAPFPGLSDLWTVKPSEATSWSSGDRGIAAAIGTGTKWWMLPNGKKLLGPDANSFSEALESLSESLPLAYMFYRLNVEQNPNFHEDFSFMVPDSVRNTAKAGGIFWDQVIDFLSDPDTYRGRGNPVHSRVPKKSQIYRSIRSPIVGH